MSKIWFRKIVKPFCILTLAAVYVCTGSSKPPESFLATRSQLETVLLEKAIPDSAASLHLVSPLLLLPHLYEMERWAVGLAYLGLAAAVGASFLCLLYFWIWLNEYFAQLPTQQPSATPPPRPIPEPRTLKKLYFPHSLLFDVAL